MMSDRPPYGKTYHKEAAYSYTLGAYATMELLHSRPEQARLIYIHSKCRDHSQIKALAAHWKVQIVQEDKTIDRLSPKENCYVIGVFAKYEDRLDKEKPHLVLVQPGDRGNLGTIVRMAAGFQISDVAIILPAVDRYHPMVIRASMGALFQIRCEAFHSFEEYRSRFHGHKLFPFLLNGDLRLTSENCPKEEKFALIFGNEATGLEEESFRSIGTSVTLPQSDRIDSLNFAMAAGIGTFLFASKNGLIG